MSNVSFIDDGRTQEIRTRGRVKNPAVRRAEMVESIDPRDLLNDNQTAVRLGVSPATLRSWRCRGIGPPFIKLGLSSNASVRYNPIDLDEFLRQGRHVPSVRAALED